MKSFKYTLCGMLASTVLAGAISAPAFAESSVVQVSKKPRQDYDALGLSVGSFYLMPSAVGGVTIDDNIYATDTGKVDDTIFNVKPEVGLYSNWNNNSFAVIASADLGYYDQNSREDYEDYTLTSYGTLEVMEGTYFDAGVDYSKLHEDRGSPDSLGAVADPTEYNMFKANVAFTRDLSLLSMKLFADYTRRNFKDADLVGGGINNNDDRDRKRYNVGLRLGYEIGDSTEAYVLGSRNKVEYDNSQEDGGPLRDGNGYRLVVGGVLDITGTTSIDVYAGYLNHDYDSSVLKDVGKFTYGAAIEWSPTELTSMKLGVSQDVVETSVSDENALGAFVPVAGILNTGVDFTIEHELMENLILSGIASYARQEFIGTVREDDVLGFGLAGEYLINRNLRLKLRYDYSDKSNEVGRGEFSRNKIMASLKLQW
ncbi:outer membrane beta-barrel protein [Gimibacter soli]|uniref:Outer membrane beta-barrel protein n=1 Tax=Gimibacter soli TaxID=3024400 RepID=A0AAF0BKV6_9PROT|nr:outer membrane beta-barrel protein [Gimibacter soli]WCL53387.1 outer membrane beta-barrel protein [Gimibacter soli]